MLRLTSCLSFHGLSTLLAAVVVTSAAAGCGPTSIDDDDSTGEGEGEGEGVIAEGEGEGIIAEGEGEGDVDPPPPPPPPPPPNDTCAQAIEIQDGETVEVNVTSAGDDVTVCGGEEADATYTFTVAADTGVHLEATAGFFGPTISIFNDGGACAEDPTTAPERLCVQGGFFEPTAIDIGLLPAGTYTIVVETFADSFFPDDGQISLTLDLVEPFCEVDVLEDQPHQGNDHVGNNIAADAFVPTFSPNGSLTSNNASSDANATFNLCLGDVDYWLVGHLGGDLTVQLDTTAAIETEIRVASFDDAAFAADQSYVFTEGDVIASSPATLPNAAPGLYLIRFAPSGDPGAGPGAAYGFSVAHGCEGDANDDPNAVVDAALDANAGFDPTSTIATEPHRVCGVDVDRFTFDVPGAGDTTIVLGGTNAGDVHVSLVQVNADGSDGASIALADAGVVGDTRRLTATLTGAAKVRAVVDAAGAVTALEYDVLVQLPPPANDLCANATVLDTLQDAAPVVGLTAGAASEMTGFCNFEDATDVYDDVFYRFTIASPVDTEILVDRVNRGSATWALYKLDGAGCPANLNALVPVGPVDNEVCQFFFNNETPTRIAQLAAGEYMIVVEGAADSPALFSAYVHTFAGGFPPPQVCVDAEAVAVPTTGDATITIPAASFSSTELSQYDGDNTLPGDTCSATGTERAFVLQPAANQRVAIKTTATVDTVLALFDGSCAATSTVCNDDGELDGVDLGLQSAFEADLVAGHTYFLLVDHFSTSESTDDIVVTISAR